jgi:GT2 family glycosyltransferase
MLSVCIVNWNNKDYLRECLVSLAAYPPEGDELEVIVVDNASEDGSAQMVRNEFPKVILIANGENKGYAEGNNQALNRAQGQTLLLLNPDVVLNKDTLTNALSFLKAHPDAGAVGIKQIGADGKIQRSLRSFPEPGPILWEYVGLSRVFKKSRVFGAYRMTWFDYERPIEADQPMGTFLLIPRKAYEDVGALDTSFPIFFNDVDWCYRAKAKGWKIYYTPDASILHYGGSGTKKAPRKAMVRESHQSLLRFYDKHYRARIVAPVYLFIRIAINVSERLASLRAS